VRFVPVSIRLPILDISPDEGDQALLDYKLTEAESNLFREMDRSTGEVPDAEDLGALHKAAHRVGSRLGLSGRQSVAFWTRATFMTFEPPCRCRTCSTP
jgi:hypothetical protein